MKSFALLLLLLWAGTTEGSKIRESTMGGDLRVESAPEGAVLRTMGGDIRVRHAGGDVVAKTMGGNIRVDRLEGSIDAGTMGGNVEIEVAGLGTGRTIEVHSMGGHIEVTLPRDFAGDFDVVLEQDDDDRDYTIRSDFPLKIEETTKRRWFQTMRVLTATGKSGSGGNRVRITTIGGEIVIRKK